MSDKTTAYIWTLIALAHAEEAMIAANRASRYLSRPNRYAEKALVAAGLAVTNAQNAAEFFLTDNYDAVILAAHQAYEFRVQALHAFQDAARE